MDQRSGCFVNTPMIVRNDDIEVCMNEKESQAVILRGRVLAGIIKFWKVEYRQPTIREIGEMTGINSTSHIRYCLEKLAESGHLIRVEREGRTSLKTQDHYYPVWIKDVIDGAE